jgi:hypothetical protein
MGRGKLTVAGTQTDAVDFRVGSKADVTFLNFDVRFTPESGHSIVVAGCPLWANNGHCHKFT